ncbi:unnamed protein product [Meloidogyne enterolobii]|uniref:Uncharacterized protein n=1 Tax=Meloidogyne enterolobii TaxID=390850 RepID=A0ACB1B0T2_MELEN
MPFFLGFLRIIFLKNLSLPLPLLALNLPFLILLLIFILFFWTDFSEALFFRNP